jgi:isopentenyldiphosphate isomerase
MSEQIISYILGAGNTPIPMDREQFYQEQIETYRKTGKPGKAVDIVNIFLFNRHQELLIQKRSNKKNHNPGLLDKSIGGHIVSGDSADYTVMVETVQELQTPSIVLRSDEDFIKTLKLLKSYIETIAIVKHHHTKLYHLEKNFGGEKVVIANRTHVYFGIYDGQIRPVDREAKGVLYYTLEELKEEMARFPNTYTADMHTYISELSPEISDFLKKSMHIISPR